MGLFNNLFGKAKNPKDDRSDYGSLFMPPSAEAGAIQAALTEEEKANFIDLLRNLQEWYDSASNEGPINFHPQARALLWGTAFAKIADHYHSIGRYDKTLFFVSTAYRVSQHPFFAYNLAILSAAAGDLKNAQILFETFLAEYQNMLTSQLLKLVNPDITTREVEDMAKSARIKLSSIISQIEAQ